MAATDDYISRVTSRIPLNTPLRTRIALDLRGARSPSGSSAASRSTTCCAQLGSPEALAESYLAAEPLVAATFWSRRRREDRSTSLLLSRDRRAARMAAIGFFALGEFAICLLPFLFA